MLQTPLPSLASCNPCAWRCSRFASSVYPCMYDQVILHVSLVLPAPTSLPTYLTQLAEGAGKEYLISHTFPTMALQHLGGSSPFCEGRTRRVHVKLFECVLCCASAWLQAKLVLRGTCCLRRQSGLPLDTQVLGCR